MTTKMIDFRGYYPLLGGSEYDFGLLLVKKVTRTRSSDISNSYIMI